MLEATKLAIEAYAMMAGTTEAEVMDSLRDGNKIVKESILMLVAYAAATTTK